MSKIKTTKQFKERVDAAFATMQTRDPTEAAVAGRPPYRAGSAGRLAPPSPPPGRRLSQLMRRAG